MNLSIVIPAFDEGRKIAADVEAASSFLQRSRMTGEIIVVDDGSSDDTSETAREAGRSLPAGVSLKVIRYNQHRGKGYAVRTGIKESEGEYVMFADSGCCVPYDDALRGLNLLKSGSCDIAHASRKLQQSDIQKAQPWYRRICARVLRYFIGKVLAMPLGITDSQCGFKMYRGDVGRKLYSRCATDGFMFDIEIILLAQKENCRIKEFAIEWVCDPDSRLSLTRAPWPVLGELWAIRRRFGRK